MKGLSKKEIEIISYLEFDKKYFFTTKDIRKFTKNRTQQYNIIKNLIKKSRIIKLNKTKYYLVPIKARTGRWSEHPFIIVDEIMNSRDYFIGDWSTANYWRLTDQIPMQVDVYTTKRQGKINVLNTRIIFHRTTKNRIKNSVKRSLQGHSFRILSKEESKKWMKLRE